MRAGVIRLGILLVLVGTLATTVSASTYTVDSDWENEGTFYNISSNGNFLLARWITKAGANGQSIKIDPPEGSGDVNPVAKYPELTRLLDRWDSTPAHKCVVQIYFLVGTNRFLGSPLLQPPKLPTTAKTEKLLNVSTK